MAGKGVGMRMWLTAMAAMCVACEASAGGTRRISLAEFRDRMEGAWLGQSIGVVPVRPPRPSALADSRNPGPVPADAKLTEEEMRKILFLPSEKEGKPSVRKMH